MAESKIEWTDRSDWNPLRGCTRVSPGCGGPGPHGGCYAEAIAGRFSDPGQAFHGFATRTAAGGRWTGKVELIEDRLTLPMRWRKPAVIFASSTSDFFHEKLSDEDIDRLFAVMALCPQHTFQVLTKRADRMRAWFVDRYESIYNAMGRLGREGFTEAHPYRRAFPQGMPWPLPNVWLGVSIEDQKRADERIPDLLATPAAVRFLSCEPLLGPVDLTNIQSAERSRQYGSPVSGWSAIWRNNHIGRAWLDWIIVGGESGRNARPMHPDWARSLRDQCATASVPFLFKQWGEWKPFLGFKDGVVRYADASGSYGPERIFRFDGGQHLVRVGKHAAGRLLDGIQHDGFPPLAIHRAHQHGRTV